MSAGRSICLNYYFTCPGQTNNIEPCYTLRIYTLFQSDQNVPFVKAHNSFEFKEKHMYNIHLYILYLLY